MGCATERAFAAARNISTRGAGASALPPSLRAANNQNVGAAVRPTAVRVGERQEAGPSKSQRLPSTSRNTATLPYGSIRGIDTKCTPAATIRLYDTSKS